ncbi:MAG: hypothetical protein AAGM67_07830 [Bacteroidota bacterium]
MRNRKYNKVLLPLVLAVWGMIGFKFWSGETSRPLNQPPETRPIVEAVVDERYALSLPFRDPFLGVPAQQARRSPKEGKKKDSHLIPQTPPQIIYKGVIESGERMGLLIWEGKSKMVVRNQQIQNARIVRIEAGFIQLDIEGKAYRIERGKSIKAG